MTSITKQVWHDIEEDIVIRRAMEKGIISMKNLAVFLLKKRKYPGDVDAIISAIRRYKEERPLERKLETARKVIAASEDIKITTNIMEIALEKNDQTQSLVQKSLSLVDYDKGELLLVMQGEKAIKLIINEKNKDKIISQFPKKSVINVESDIAQINIQLSPEAVRTPGIITTLTSELMLHDINLVEMMSCVPEMLIFVKQKDIVKTYQTLFELCRTTSR